MIAKAKEWATAPTQIEIAEDNDMVMAVIPYKGWKPGSVHGMPCATLEVAFGDDFSVTFRAQDKKDESVIAMAAYKYGVWKSGDYIALAKRHVQLEKHGWSKIYVCNGCFDPSEEDEVLRACSVSKVEVIE